MTAFVRFLSALACVAALSAPLVGQGRATRRPASTPLPTYEQLLDGLQKAQLLAQTEMPWRTGDAAHAPALVARLLLVALHGGDLEEMRASIHQLQEWQDYQAVAPRPPPHGQAITGRLRVVHGRFANEAGPIGWYGISEFDAIDAIRRGREADLVRRLDRAAAAGRNVVRVLGMARLLFDLHPGQDGYWQAVDRLFELAAARGQYVEFVVFADAQLILPAPDARRDLVQALARRYSATTNVIWSLVNEPFKNGFTEADDADLIHLAEVLASEIGHRDFVIGDPRDGETPRETEETFARFRTLAKHSNILVLHASRTEATDGRWRRWVDHLRILVDVLDDVRKINPHVAAVHNEPMGAASAREPGRRDSEPDAFVAAALAASATGTGFTYHYISAQDDATPGLMDARVARELPSDGAWQYRNDSHAGAATAGFSGADKVRTWTDGTRAFVVAYGHDANRFAPLWANGFQPRREVYRSRHVVLWYAER